MLYPVLDPPRLPSEAMHSRDLLIVCCDFVGFLNPDNKRGPIGLSELRACCLLMLSFRGSGYKGIRGVKTTLNQLQNLSYPTYH